MMIKSLKKEKELNELYGIIPRVYLAYSNGITFTLFAILIAMAFYIEFPHKIMSTAILTTTPAPEIVTTSLSNEIESIVVLDGDIVSEGDPLIIMKSDADYVDIKQLQKLLDEFDLNGRLAQEFSGNDSFNIMIEGTKEYKLGTISEPVYDFKYALNHYSQHISSLDYRAKNLSLNTIKNEIKSRLHLRKSQVFRIENELEILHQNESRYRLLLEKGVISQKEFNKEIKEILISEERLNTTLVNISNEKELMVKNSFDQSIINIDWDRKTLDLQNLLLSKFEFLQLAISNWERHYVIKSNTDGRVLFTKNLIENSLVEPSSELMLIEPVTIGRNINAEALVTSLDFGKLQEKQTAIIVLDGFPENEFGFLTGTVSKVYQVPNQNGQYTVEMSLGSELQTSRNFLIPFRPNLKGSVEIIVEEKSLIKRIFSESF